ncbi:MAG: GtrA family protein [Patescibacteria group bacterium]
MFFVYRGSKKFFRSIFPSFYNKIEKYKIIIKYIISGGTAAVVDLSALYFFTSLCGIWYVLSSSLAFLLAYFVSFSLQKFWTFRDNGREKIRQQMYLYFIVGVANLFLNGAGMYLLVDELGVMYLLAQIIIGAILGFSSFIIYRFVIFEKRKIGEKKLRGDKKRILIAVGIFPPDIGGPAVYVKNLLEELPKLGYEIKVITYADFKNKEINDSLIFRISRRQNIFFRYIKYFLEVLKLSEWADVVYIHDLASTGLPCSLVKTLKPRLKLVVRLGGDFLWEKAYNNGWTEKPLSQYYEQPKNFFEKIFLLCYKFVLAKCDKIIFSTEWQKEIYEKYLKVDPGKTTIIDNAFPEYELPAESFPIANKNILLAGRLIKLKNFARVFEAIKNLEDIKITVIGEGPEKNNLKNISEKLNLDSRISFRNGIEQSELAGEIKKSFLVLVPSITEISPNLVLECIKLAKPIVTTKECGFFKKYADKLIFVDPFDINDIKEKITFLSKKENHDNYLEKIRSIDASRNKKNLAEDHHNFFKNL